MRRVAPGATLRALPMLVAVALAATLAAAPATVLAASHVAASRVAASQVAQAGDAGRAGSEVARPASAASNVGAPAASTAADAAPGGVPDAPVAGATGSGARGIKIGVIHTERILKDSAPARAALARIEQAFKQRDGEIAAREQAVRDRAAQYQKDKPSLSEEQRAERERALDNDTRDVQRQRQQFVEDLRTRQFEELDKLKARLDEVLTRLARDQHYDLILQDALWVGKRVDITDQVIKSLGP